MARELARDLDRHSWCGSTARLSRIQHHLAADFVLPLSVLKLDPADRAVLRIAGTDAELLLWLLMEGAFVQSQRCSLVSDQLGAIRHSSTRLVG